ncbi:4-amino-4-deoxy-L-arabinose transferase-like glycosyltransferase [Wenyingzhuangia heitensis]|uniref:4-amino-4-deoxy-L-arabinose transferase-like glycosyltransferase n=1 Tax=Wenyingzhuangia heitensis TaxID=1487859 RepID=A0ABX0U9A0_9FLAO|nr:glycosyltransferase family 39 protein [Wenyingzhuangia heitensis]NIJ45387.1 4-amino-4-deoxy-L-arabinose transferase-like glycosyltransferase [Wenyingzhuangia heitensis]
MGTFIKKNALMLSVFALVLLRAIVDAWLPLLDKTEARYAEIARIMYETGNWVTPQIDYGVPFWAKPPMSTWISALSFQVFGVNEFAARFPSLLIHILLIVFVAKALKYTKQQGFLLALVLLTIPEYYIHSGVVSTDSSLLVGITFIMIGFWKSIQAENNTIIWKLVSWLGVAIGLLSKGPIVLVLTVPPLFIWACFYKGKLVEFFKKALWVPGLLLAFVISFSWYYLAEISTPGFIDYFFVGEHYKRFFESGWKGDKYGFAKQQPKGMIWIFLILFSMPWIQFVITKVIQKKKEVFKNEWVTFLWLWMLWTPFFFTVSKSLIHTYTLPCTIPLGLLVFHYFESFKKHKSWFVTAAVVPIALVIGFIGMNTLYTDRNWQNTDKHLLNNIEDKSLSIYAWEFKSYSSQFYTNGAIKIVKDKDALELLIKKGTPFYLLSRNSHYKSIPVVLKEKLNYVGKNKKSQLFEFHK